MVQFKKRSLYTFFPLVSIISLVSIRLIELDYPTREPQLFREYLFLVLVLGSFYLFLIAYLIPLFMSLRLSKLSVKLLTICILIVSGCYIIISLYGFFIKKEPDLLPQKFDIIIGSVVGIALGLISAVPDKL